MTIRPVLAMAAGAAFLGATVTAVAPFADAVPDGSGRVEGGTFTATFEVRGATGGRDVTVTAEPGTGRLQVSPYYWDRNSGGRYLHVGFGTSAGSGCTVSRWVVVDTSDPVDLTAAAYDGDGAALPATELPLSGNAEWDQIAVRVETTPVDAVDCVKAASHASADPADPGAAIWSHKAVPLTTVGFNDRNGTFPATVGCPTEVAAGDTLDVAVGYSTDPGTYPGAGIIPRPSGFGALDFTVDPSESYTVASAPEPRTDVDLWTDEPWTGDLSLQLDPSELYFVRVSGTVSIDGTAADWGCSSRIPVTVPVPTDWTGTLAGKTWWVRGEASNSGIGDYVLHRAYEFLDDEWVYVDDEYSGPHTDPCTKAASNPSGCHRYYYDADSGRLQIDDRLARPRAGGWGMPTYGGRYQNYFTDHVVRPVTTGQRLAYSGKGRHGVALTLRKDGTYTCHYCIGGERTSGGRYRFVGGDAQQLVLHRPGPDLRTGVQLYYAPRDGHPRLYDIDTDIRTFRVQRW